MVLVLALAWGAWGTPVYATPTSVAGRAPEMHSVVDAEGRSVAIAENVERVICSGAGCLRLLTYLGAQQRVVAVDSLEVRGSPIDARPYAIANPQFKKLPIFGEFRGYDSPELIAGLNPQPQVIFRTLYQRGQSPDQLQGKTGIPVVTLDYGNLTYARDSLDRSLRLLGRALGLEQRAEAVIAYFNDLERDLRQRTRDLASAVRPRCYIGGLGMSGPHGIQSTEPSYAPFVFVNAGNVAAPSAAEKSSSHAMVAKEQLVFWDPEVIFIDVSTLCLGGGENAPDQLRSDPSYEGLAAVRGGRIYGLFPNVSYAQNYETVFANAYYVGKVLYPDLFEDVDPMAKAEQICRFLNGGPAFEQLNKRFDGLAFSRITVR